MAGITHLCLRLVLLGLQVCGLVVGLACVAQAGGDLSSSDQDRLNRILVDVPNEAYRPPTAGEPRLGPIAKPPPAAMQRLIRAPAAWGVLVAGVLFVVATTIGNRAGGLVNAWPESSAVEAIAAGFSASVLMLIVRASLLLALREGSPGWPASLFLANQDVALVSGTAILFGGLGAALYPVPALRRAFIWCVRALCLLWVLHSYLNLVTVESRGVAWSGQWRRFADGFGGPPAAPPLAIVFSVHTMASLAALTAAYVILLEGTRRLIRAVHSEAWRVITAGTFCIVVGGYLQVSGFLVHAARLPMAAIVNPILYGLEGASGGLAFAKLLDEPAPAWAAAEFQRIAEGRSEHDRSLLTSTPERDGASESGEKITNVVLVIVQGLPPTFFSQPEPDAGTPVGDPTFGFRTVPAVVRDAYAPAPSPEKSLYAVLSGIKPPLTYDSPIRSDPSEAKTEALGALLSQAGYATWYAHITIDGLPSVPSAEAAASAAPGLDPVAQYMLGVGIQRELDTTTDCTQESKPWTGCTVAALKRELAAAAAPDGKPFFGVVLHGVEPRSWGVPVEVDGVHGRGIRTELGEIAAALNKNGLAESTAVVVVGTGRLAAMTGSALLDRYVRVALAVFDPRAASRRGLLPATAELSDVVPTIAALLDLPTQPSWSGRSVFDRTNESLAYFFSPDPPYEFGLRDRNWKTVYAAGASTLTMFNLDNDPDEQVDVAMMNQRNLFLQRCRLAAWVQGVDFFGR